jgi:hypothetical protein
MLRLILRLFGTSSLLATIFVAAPESWMADIHAELGMGVLPDAPVVGYLARSTSAFYAIMGGLFWTVSFDTARHRTVLMYLGGALAAFGLSLYVIDVAEGMPWLWSVWEGTAVAGFGLLILFLARREQEGPRR